jgi:hypothetical protein
MGISRLLWFEILGWVSLSVASSIPETLFFPDAIHVKVWKIVTYNMATCKTIQRKGPFN